MVVVYIRITLLSMVTSGRVAEVNALHLWSTRWCWEDDEGQLHFADSSLTTNKPERFSWIENGANKRFGKLQQEAWWLVPPNQIPLPSGQTRNPLSGYMNYPGTTFELLWLHSVTQNVCGKLLESNWGFSIEITYVKYLLDFSDHEAVCVCSRPKDIFSSFTKQFFKLCLETRLVKLQ